MNILYLIGALLVLIVLGYPYFLLVMANREKGATRVIGWVMSGSFVVVFVLLVLSYQLGIVTLPDLQFMPERPSTRIVRGMSGYVTGMMLEDEKAIDEFIDSLKTKPELFEKVREKLR